MKKKSQGAKKKIFFSPEKNKSIEHIKYKLLTMNEVCFANSESF